MSLSMADVDDELAGMSLEQKVGQTMIVSVLGASFTPEIRRLIEEFHIGGIILFGKNVRSRSAVKRLTVKLQHTALRTGHTGLIICVDQEGGRVSRLTVERGFTEFPSAMALAATGEIQNVRDVARAIARQLKAVGINMNLAPVLDVNNNPANPVIGTRSFASDAERVAEMGAAFIEATQEEGVMAVGKHFPGHGDTFVDSHVSLPIVPHGRDRLESVELIPFKAAIQSEVAGIMTAHVVFPEIEPATGMPATLSSRVLSGLLRTEMHYGGLLVTDSLEMEALAKSGYSSSQAAVAA